MTVSRKAKTAPALRERITLTTLGRLDIDGPDDRAARRLLSQPKRLAVLLYLRLSQRGGACSRDQLLGVFWPESDAANAQNALRQTLSFVRGCAGSEVIVSVGTTGLIVADSVECDAVRFEALLDAGRTEDALRIYGGELLPGFHIAGSNAFSVWLDGRRAHLAHRAAKAAWDLSAECESQGETAGAAFWGKRALALSPFSESEVQRLIRLLERVGDFAGALRAYTGLQKSLEAEFGATPSIETTRLASGIRARLASEGVHIPALLGTRRSGLERRLSERRESAGVWTRAERRKGGDRRSRERRTGVDRRLVAAAARREHGA